MEQQRVIQRRSFDRREFTLTSALALVSGVAITLTACDSEGGSAGPTPPAADRAAAISDNHGHAGVVTGGQLSAGRELLLDIRGAADHPHSVSLSVSDLESIAAGRRIAKSSSNDLFHTHTVTFN